MQGDLRRMPWHAPVWDKNDFVPGFVRKHVPFWRDVILKDHPLRDTLVSYLRDGVDIYDLLLEDFKGPSTHLPYNIDRFPGAEFRNYIPQGFDQFVETEISSLLLKGCVVRWEDVRSPSGPARPRLRMAMSVETTKPRLIFDARPLNECCMKKPFAMDTVSRVGLVAEKGCYMTSLDDCSAFHQILLKPSSWPLFGFSYKGVDYCFCVLPFGFSLSPWVYHTLGDAKAAFLRSKGMPALAYLDDSWLSNFLATFGRTAREQWLAAAEATHVAMLVSFLCGQFLSLKKCELRPQTVIQYLGMMCDSTTTTFRIPQDKLDKLQLLVKESLDSKRVSFRTLQRIAGKCMSMTVAIRPASLWTRAMFNTIASFEKGGPRVALLDRDEYADLRAEFQQWLSLTTTSHEGLWQRARHYTASITNGASDASSIAWGGIVNTVSLPSFRAGGVFPSEWLPKHINKKEMYALHELLRLFCVRYPEVLRGAQVLIDEDNESVVGAFNKGRAKDRDTHAILVQLFDLQMAHGFMLSLKWVPSASNAIADAISRPSRESIIRLKPHVFQKLWDHFGPFDVDLMACNSSAQRVPGTPKVLPFFSRYDCKGSAGIDAFANDVSIVPGTGRSAFSYCFPPPVMAGHLVQHLKECEAHAVVVLPGTHAYWFPLVQQACCRSRIVADRNETGIFSWPGKAGRLQGWRYPMWSMHAYELDFRTK